MRILSLHANRSCGEDGDTYSMKVESSGVVREFPITAHLYGELSGFIIVEADESNKYEYLSEESSSPVSTVSFSAGQQVVDENSGTSEDVEDDGVPQM